jgi:LacI family transcriptional regulator
MAMSATINDVAKQAGVSIKTVSRVVNREPNVREGTRNLVLAAIKELNYKPSLAARGLAGGRSFLFGLIYDNPSDSFLVKVQRGILEACREHHYGLALCPAVSQSTDLKQSMLDWIAYTQPDAVILTPPLSDNEELAQALVEKNVRFACVASAGLGYAPAVHIDEVAAAKAMTDHLISLGHARIGFIKGRPDHVCSALRYQGYLDALQSAGLEKDPQLVSEGEFDFESGVRAAEYLLSLPERPTAIFTSNDEMASGVINVAHQRGIILPDGLAVAGFDDTPLSRQLWPALTTVRQPIDALGRKAVELLLTNVISENSSGTYCKTGEIDMHEAENKHLKILDFELQERASTLGVDG